MTPKIPPAAKRRIPYLWSAGQSMAEIAQPLGVMPQAVNWLLRANAVPKSGGRRPRVRDELGCGGKHHAKGKCRRHYEHHCSHRRPERRAAMLRIQAAYKHRKRAGLKGGPDRIQTGAMEPRVPAPPLSLAERR